MVSLSRNMHQAGGGVTFFSDNMNSYHDDDPLLSSMPVLPQEPVISRWMAEEMKKFRTICTPKVILFTKVLYVCLGVAAYLIPAFCKEKRCGHQEVTSLLMYVHGGMWFLLLLVHMYLYHEHRNSLLHGYFTFHLETRTLRRAPLFINSGANAILVVVSRVLDAVCHPDGTCAFLTKTRYLQILICVEVVIALSLLIVYFVRTVRFNNAKDTPDFLRTATSEQTSRSQSQIGFRKGSYEEQKKVAMMLMWYEVFFWKQKRISLCHDILCLSDKLDKLAQQDKSLAPFDMQAWALGQCWNEVYQLRHGCVSLIQEKQNLIYRVKEYLNVSGTTIN